MANNLFKKFMEFGIGSLITLLLGFITSPIITRMITPEQNGKFSMFNTITNLLLIIAVLGLDQSYVRYYYEEEEKNRGNLLRNCIIMPIFISIIVGICIVIFYRTISIYIVEEQSILVSLLLSINLLVSVFLRFALLQVRMQQRAKLYSLLNIISKILNLLFVLLLFLFYKNNYMTLILATIFTNIIVVGISIILERNEWFGKENAKLNTSKIEIIKYGLPLIFSMAMTWIFQSTDRIIIKEFCGYEQVGLYSGAMTIIALLNTVQTTFTTFWTPVAFERYSINPNDKEFFEKINKIVVVIMLFMAIGLIACKDIIVLLLGDEYRQAMFIFPYLVFMPIMYTISETTVVGVNFKKKSKVHIYIAIIAALFNLVGNIILVPKFGARGAAISTGLAYIVFFIARTYFSNKFYNVNYNLKKFSIATIMIYILATYSSFYKFNIIILILTIISMVTIGGLYKDTIVQIYKYNRK